MYLLIHVIRTVTAAEEAHIVETAVGLDKGHTAGDDVDVVTDGKLDEAVAYLLGILRQSAYGLRLAHIIEAGHKGCVEVFGEEHEVALVVAHRVDKELHLLEEVVQILVGTHLPLHQTQSHRRPFLHIRVGGRLVVDVVPLEQRGTVLGLLVIGQIVADDAAHVEIIGQLEREHRVVDLARAYLLDIFLRAHGVGILVVVGYATAKHNGLQIELLTEFLAVFIHAASESQPAIVGMDKHLDAVEDVALRVVGVEGLVARYLGIGVVALYHIIVYDNREGTAYYLVVDHYHHLTLGEDGNERLDLLVGPEDIVVGIDALERFGQLIIVFHTQVAQFHFIDFVSRFHKNTIYLDDINGAKVAKNHHIYHNFNGFNARRGYFWTFILAVSGF